jgi:hypothetical protein
MSVEEHSTNDLIENQEIEHRAAALVAGLDEQSFVWRPEPGRWAIGECLEHLNLTANTFLPLLDAAMDGGEPRPESSEAVRPGFAGRWFVRILEPPAKLKVKAPGSVRPAPELSMSDVTERFTSARRGLESRVVRAREFDLNRTKMHHPAIPVVRFSLGEIFGIIFAHERRHLWQAEVVRRQPAFPSNQ